ncbi:MAG: hypothetical protein KA603_01135 [Azonexus sp.]|nr:hypothetical protein [Betaproteobacteria bacterium]MBP6034723.1 hypothetical protein [Azonexus sp.]MBP6905263.1 hypothetical protein [Azonexus sp.]
MSIEALDDLSNEVRSSASDPLFSFSTYVSIAGVTPANAVQMLSYQPEGTSPSHSIFLSPKFSFSVIRDFEVKNIGNSNDDPASHVAKLLEGVQSQALTVSKFDLQAAALSHLLENNLFADPQRNAGTLAQIKRMFAGEELNSVDQGKALLAKVTGDLAKVRGELDKAREKYDSAVGSGNILVTRWEVSGATGGGATVGPIVSAGGSGSNTRTGFLVLAGMRSVSLHVGEDFFDMVRELDKDLIDFLARVGVTTYTLQARHTAHAQELDAVQELSLRLNLTPDQLRKLSQAFKDAAFSLDYYRRFSRSLGNRGVLSAPRETIRSSCFFPPRAHFESIVGGGSDKPSLKGPSDGYRTVLAVRAAVGKRVLELADKKIKTELYYIGSRDGKRGFDDDKSRALDDWLNQCRGKTGPLGGKEYEPVDYWRGTIHGEDARGGNSAGGEAVR